MFKITLRSFCCLQAVAVALYNPESFRAFGQARLDVGRVLPERMSDESYRELLVSLGQVAVTAVT